MVEITLEEILRDKNALVSALEFLEKKKDSCGVDGIFLSGLREYVSANWDEITELLLSGQYEPGLVETHEIIKYNGKRRIISKYCSIDRLILRLLENVLQAECEGLWSDCSYAYRANRSIVSAADTAAGYIESGKEWVVEIDLENYFDSVPHGRMKKLINETIKDMPLRRILFKYLQVKIIVNGNVQKKDCGLVQGCALSPLWSNLFLNEFDSRMEKDGISYVRYADNMYVYTTNEEKALEIYSQLTEELKIQYKLSVNLKKSGVYVAENRKFLGYYFERKNKKVFVKKIERKNYLKYSQWHPSAIECIDQNYHIVNNGILSKQDFTLLFENENGKRYLPVESVENISIYSDVIFSGGFFEFANQHNLRVSIYDRYGTCIGSFLPVKLRSNTNVLMKQAAVYTDQGAHLRLAKKMNSACMHNIRMNILYYMNRKKSVMLTEMNSYLIETNNENSKIESVDELLLSEARARQKYYMCFNEIINDDDFCFTKRTRRPPKDAINALISFGNTFLYNRIATEIYKTPLDIRFGLIHATNRRTETLNLDIADLFKPIVIDKVIFTLINKRMLDIDTDFAAVKEDGVYLTINGKKKFIRELQKKLNQKVTIKNKSKTYIRMIRDEIWKLVDFYNLGKEYKPYKHQI